MILTREKILEEIEQGRVEIDPYDPALVGPASIDLRLGGEIRTMDPGSGPIDVEEAIDYRRFSTLRKLDQPFDLVSGQTILGITLERVRLPADLCAWLEGRSRFARLGLLVHVTAGFLSPGINNRQVLEIANLSGRTLRLRAGTPVCQIILQRTEGSAVYRGRFADQSRV
ncbi:MAG: dCTP deaminase [Deltaproteobacteria bacterium]|nr:MAG: dCTP deaminase [Deltaproteobacteria bacterium]